MACWRVGFCPESHLEVPTDGVRGLTCSQSWRQRCPALLEQGMVPIHHWDDPAVIPTCPRIPLLAAVPSPSIRKAPRRKQPGQGASQHPNPAVLFNTAHPNPAVLSAPCVREEIRGTVVHGLQRCSPLGGNSCLNWSMSSGQTFSRDLKASSGGDAAPPSPCLLTVDNWSHISQNKYLWQA